MTQPSARPATMPGRPAFAGIQSPRVQLALRIAAAALGGYAFCWGFIALCIAGLFAVGMQFHDAEHLASMLTLLLYLVVFLWAFVARSLARVWAVLVGSGALMAGAASLVQWSLLR
jgi:hypothetical protein